MTEYDAPEFENETYISQEIEGGYVRFTYEKEDGKTHIHIVLEDDLID